MVAQALLGLIVLIAIAWLFSENRRAVPWPGVLLGFVMQFALALLLLKLPLCRELFLLLNQAMLALEEATRAGTRFVFGFLGGGELPFAEVRTGASFILAFRALPLVLVVSALSSLLFYWGVLPRLVRAFAWCLQRSLGIGGALGLSAAADVFVGMVEAPLLVRPYLERMTRAELFALMSCGMATIAGTVMVLYATVLGPVIPDAMGHILTASLVSVPAALVVAQVMVPETGTATAGDLVPPLTVGSSLEAITEGTLAGMRLLANIVALLVVCVALVHLFNQLIGLLPEVTGQPLTLQRLLGWLLAPLAWLLGIPWAEAPLAGQLLGIKTVLNELLAYLELAHLPETALSLHSRLILVYALCGFANLGSLGILLGGLTALAPGRRTDIVTLAPKSIVSGTLATCLTGAMVGLLV